MTQPLSNRGTKTGCVVVFFSMFALVGLVFLYFIFPIFKIIAARSWEATPCVIVSSSVGRHADSKGATYSVDIVYTYDFHGTSHTGKHYQFVQGSSSGRSGKAAVVAHYPPGSKATCYVNPGNPDEAVIVRGFTPDMWFALIPLVFIVIGVKGAVYFAGAKKRALSQSQILWQPAGWKPATDYSAVPTAPRELKPATTPFTTLLVVIAMALFWNTIVGLFVHQAYVGWNSKHADWFLMVFLVPFVLVGIALLCATGYQFLALFTPRAHLTINPGAVALGETLVVEWRLEGRISALRNIVITLEGSEEATYQSGKNSRTDKHVFSTTGIADSTNAADFPSGRATVTLPRDAMHSFDSGSNKIVWKFNVKGTIPRWSDMGGEYPLVVLPLRKEKLS